jgi:anti-anti-sigma regulatory factor
VADDLLAVTIARNGNDELIVRLHGEVLGSNADEFRRAIDIAAESSELKSLTIDCSDVRGADTVGYDLLERARDVAERRAMTFTVLDEENLAVPPE